MWHSPWYMGLWLTFIGFKWYENWLKYQQVRRAKQEALIRPMLWQIVGHSTFAVSFLSVPLVERLWTGKLDWADMVLVIVGLTIIARGQFWEKAVRKHSETQPV